MFGHAEGKLVSERIMAAYSEDGMLTSNLIALASDGPNVNKTIWRQVDKCLTDAGNRGLIDVGTCNVHVAHNAFRAALDGFATDVEELAIDLHTFF
jgi:hypothetical protein